MSNSTDLFHDPFFHIRKVGDRWLTQGVASCTLGHEIRTASGTARDGIFAGWKWDGERLSVVNDRFGFYPLYYYVREGECGMSSSIPTLLALGATSDLDYAALAVFFHLGFFLGEDTPFCAIRAVPPDVSFEWCNGKLAVSGRLSIAKPQTLDRNQALDAYIEVFRQAIQRRLPKDKKFAVLLSGGRDSRHILFELLRHGARPTFCVTLDFKGSQSASDAVVAANVAKAVDIPHVVVPTKHPDFQQEFDKNLITNFCADEHAWFLPAATYLKEKVGTVYDGIGGDVLSAGLLLDEQRLQLSEAGRFRELAQDLIGSFSNNPLLRSSVKRRVTRDLAVDRMVEELKRHAEAANPFGSFIFWNRTRREISLAPHRILKEIESVFCPYLDYDVCELLAGLPGRMFVDHTFHTDTISRAFPEHAHIAYAVDDAPDTPDRRLCRRFVAQLARYAIGRESTLLKKGSLFARLLRCLCDPRYLPSILWFGPAAIYLLQLEVLITQSSCRVKTSQDTAACAMSATQQKSHGKGRVI